MIALFIGIHIDWVCWITCNCLYKSNHFH